MEFVDSAGSLGVAQPARRLDSCTVSIELPKALERAMLDAGLVDPRTGNPSLNQWSKESGVHTSTISGFINGRKARPENVQKLAKALGVSPAAVYGMVGRNLFPWTPPQGTERLNVRQRQALNELILAFIGESAEGAGDGDADRAATPITPAAGSAADDGLGAFGHRDRGDLDHESVNDGGGENVHELFTPPPPASKTAAYRTRSRDKEEEERSRQRGEESQDDE